MCKSVKEELEGEKKGMVEGRTQGNRGKEPKKCLKQGLFTFLFFILGLILYHVKESCLFIFNVGSLGWSRRRIV